MMDHGVRVVDLMQYTPLGGVHYYDVFHLPPQAHHVNGWEIRQVIRKEFQCCLLTPDPAESQTLDPFFFPGVEQRAAGVPLSCGEF